MSYIEKIKQLRKETNISLASCREALEKSKGDIEKAKISLKEKGFKIILEKSSSETKQGIIHSYVHSNKKIGVLIDLRCQTDFIAQSEKFQKLAHDLCLQITATNPLYIKAEDISSEILEREKKIYKKQLVDQNKPEKIIGMIVEGKMKKYFEETCLLFQSFIKDPEKKIKDIIQENIIQLKENIVIKSFVRYHI